MSSNLRHVKPTGCFHLQQQLQKVTPHYPIALPVHNSRPEKLQEKHLHARFIQAQAQRIGNPPKRVPKPKRPHAPQATPERPIGHRPELYTRNFVAYRETVNT
uniref:Uncharacterized protein n=1 Tax=Anopheles culicifacies TaxID=139723 RepID=A0A182MSE7_9DIPT